MDFKQTYFELFGINTGFDIDQAELATRYRELQRGTHPDRFASGTDQQKRLAVQWTAHINQAYTTLKNPLARAVYLLKLADLEIELNPALPGLFLMEQIELREELETLEEREEEALPDLDQFKRRIRDRLGALDEEFRRVYPADLKSAELVVYKMQFIHKLLHEAGQLEEQLLDY